MRHRLNTSVKRILHFLIAVVKPDRPSFRDILDRVQRDDCSVEEEETLLHITREVIVPAAKWLCIGVILTVLVFWAQELIGTAIIVLSIYLIYGLYRFEHDNESNREALKKEIASQQIFFTTDMERRIRTQYLLIATVTLFFIILSAFILHQNGRLAVLTGRIIHFWKDSTPEAQIDFIAVIVFIFTSIFVATVSIFRVAQFSNVIVTEKGVYISDSFLPWCELKEAETEYFFQRPVYLTLNTFGGSIIKIQLSRLKISDAKVEEITSLVNRRISAERNAAVSSQKAQ